ncbi:DUF3822 family protein [Ferruginibacter albus]|uniref:DUF3822 family protein n=1 Tax=Ferruginibacter albus TaxID=2875540 RepID=UPI001CC79D5E|nr:DUF3822 family protein [Ferruginibacter albus]UAY50648.1 DUF3822 family protein [Ferruginibacter albus]
MNTLFNLQPNNIDTSQATLLMILGLHGISYTILNENSFEGIGFYTFGADISLKKVATSSDKIISGDSFLRKEYKNIKIVYSFTDAVLVPSEIINDESNSDMLDLLYGYAQEEVLKKDFLASQSLYNIYRVPSDVNDYLSGTFPSATYIHLHTVLPQLLKDVKGAHMYCIFGTNHVTVMLKINDALQIIQKFTYKTPEDVSYYLLKICAAFNAPVNETTLHVTGLLDKVSTLYTEIYRYFINIFFEGLPEGYTYGDEIKTHPSHFFSHLFSLAACV